MFSEVIEGVDVKFEQKGGYWHASYSQGKGSTTSSVKDADSESLNQLKESVAEALREGKHPPKKSTN